MAIFGWGGLKNINKKSQTPRPELGTGPATKCEGCGEILMKKALEDHLGVCPRCDHHHYISAHRRIEVLLDDDTFVERDTDLVSSDPLNFKAVKSYKDSLQAAIRNTEMLSAMVSGTGNLFDRKIAIGVTDSAFLAGSMGSVVGEKISRITEHAIENGLALVLVSGSGGGARMHESMYSLMQMAKSSASLARLRKAGLPFISVVTDCTMGGTWASWAALGDVIIAEPKAMVGFTGARVIKTTINAVLPEGFQRSEFLLEHGQVDMIVHRSDMRERLGSILDKIMGPVAEAV